MAARVIDLHCDSVFSLMAGKDIRFSVPGVHVDLPRLKKGGVGLQVFAAYVPAETPEAEAFSYAGKRLDAIDAFARSDESLALVETSDELKAVMASRKTGIMAAVENGSAIENSLSKLEALRRRKVRIMTLVHSAHLPWIASSTGSGLYRAEGENEGGGLSSFGGKVIDAMCGIGIIPDLSHASESAFWDVLRRAKKPLIASHSCAYGLCAHPRNLKDDQLKALGDSGGLVGVNFYSTFLSEDFRVEYEKHRGNPAEIHVKVPSRLIADHIEYMVKIAGEDCVAIGSDFDGIPFSPEAVSGPDFFPLLEGELKSRGFSEKRVEKIFGANFLRLFDEWNR